MKKLLSLFLAFILCACQTTTDTQKDTSKQACDSSQTACEVDEGTSQKEFEEITMDDAIAYFTEKKSGVLYFGFDTCPWCKEASPILKEVANDLNVDVAYCKTRDDDHNLLYTDEQKETFTQYIGEYMSENDEGVLTLYVPLVLVVKDGVVVDGHESTIDGHDAQEREMTDDEKAQLKEIYETLLGELD